MVQTVNTLLMENGQGVKVELSVVEAKVLQILRSEWIGIYGTATAENPQQIQAGTARFRVPEMNQVENYTKANRNNDPQITNVDTIDVLLDKTEKIAYELETMDLSGFTNAGEVQGVLAQGLSTAILSHLDAQFLKVAQEAAIANVNIPYIVNATFGQGRTEADIDTQFYDTVDLVKEIEGTIDKKIVGVNKPEVLFITNTGAGARFIKAAGGGNAAERTFTGTVESINGINLVQHPYVGKNIPAGSSFAKDLSFDFSALAAIALHTEAIAMPFALQSISQAVDANSGNPKVIAKMKYGVKAIRPNLVAGIFLEDPNPSPSQSITNVIGTDPSAMGLSDGAIDFDVSISDFTGAGTATLNPVAGTSPVPLTDGANTGLAFTGLPAGSYDIEVRDDGTIINPTSPVTLTDPAVVSEMKKLDEAKIKSFNIHEIRKVAKALKLSEKGTRLELVERVSKKIKELNGGK